MKLRRAILVGLLMLWATPAFSQGCAMCYSSAKSASTEGQKAISRGVLVLLVPPLGFMSLGVWMACRYARRRDLQHSAPVNWPLEHSTKPVFFQKNAP
jgi:hypothetical protein